MSAVRGNLYTVSAPSGAGKTSLVKALVAADAQLRVSVSHTTRPQRPGEIDGTNYYFVAPEKFRQMAKAGDFLEHATVFGNAYGTSKGWVEKQLAHGFDVVLEIDWQGALQAHEQLRQQSGAAGIGIFILPPSLATLQARLTQRGQDDATVIDGRMAAAVDELSHFAQADYLVVNDDFDTALDELAAIFTATRLHLAQQRQRHSGLLATLLDDLVDK